MTKVKLAKLASGVINPFIVGITLIVMLSLSSFDRVSDALRWSLALTAIGLLPILLVLIYMLRSDRIEDFFISVRQQRYRIFILAGICNIINCILLIWLDAPVVLTASYFAALASIIIFMCINFFWKISMHTAFASATVVILIIIFGSIAAFAAVILPIVAWARVELKQHSFAQVTAGSVLAAGIVVLVFHLFGLIGNARF